MAKIKCPMAEIETLMAKTHRDGGNYPALWRKLSGHGENFLQSDLEWMELRLFRDGRSLG